MNEPLQRGEAGMTKRRIFRPAQGLLEAAEVEIPPDFVIARQGLRRAFFANSFKIPTLWGVKHTAPYFHDNSAKTLAELVDHYEFYFQQLGLPIELTEQDKADMVAFMELL